MKNHLSSSTMTYINSQPAKIYSPITTQNNNQQKMVFVNTPQKNINIQSQQITLSEVNNR
jgi:hypothetical protein